MKAAIYTRVSHHRQVSEGHGLETQEARCRAYADAQGWEISAVFSDGGVSGRRSSRPGLDALKAEAEKYDRIICFKLSRLGRSARDVLNTLHDFQERGLEVVFVEDGLDTSNPSHRLIILILSGVAEIEADNNAEHALAGMEESAAAGIWQGGPAPFGYLINPEGRLEPHPENAEIVRKMATLVLAGASTQEVANSLNASGNKPPKGGEWKSAEVRRHLRRPSIKGELSWADVPIKAEPIIHQAEFDRLQRILDQTSLPRQADDVWPLSQRTFCTCGGYLIAGGRRGGRGRAEKTRYYRCANHKGDTKGQCLCDHDQYPRRPKWWRADESEALAWRSFVSLLNDRGQLNLAMDLHLGQTSDGLDEAHYQKVCQNLERLDKAVVKAAADRYSATNRERHDRILEELTGRLQVAEAERDRLEVMRANRERAEELRAKWVEVADGYLLHHRDEMPTRSEMAHIFTELDVAFQVHTSPHSFSLTEDGSIQHGWLYCRGLLLPSMSLDGGSARPYP